MATLTARNVATTTPIITNAPPLLRGSALSIATGSRCRLSVASFRRREIFGFCLSAGSAREERSTKSSKHGVQRRYAVAEKAPENGAAEVVIPEKSISVILLAGGKGKRMGANMPKQYLPLLGQPIALHSFHTFADMPEVLEIVVVCDPSYRDIFEEAKVGVPIKFALPGKERQHSVRSGLEEISKSAKLACIHDSARPLVLPKDILKVMKDAWTTGAAVLGVPVKATIKEAGEDRLVTKTLDRRTLWEMQTPQVIEPQLLHRGFELVEREGYEVTDDVSIVEYLKHPVQITEGNYTNLKVTTPDDLVVAERILHQSTPTAVAAYSANPVVV
ncbi:unnamed protein product [Calypogeia fissa]